MLTTSTKVSIKQLLKTTHLNVTCQQCDKAYSTKAHLKAHIHSAHEGLKYACHECEKQYMVMAMF